MALCRWRSWGLAFGACGLTWLTPSPRCAVATGDGLLDGLRLGDCTLAGPVNALGPIAANGAWAQDGPAIVAAATEAPWTIQLAGEETWTDYLLTAKVTIREPGPRADYRISSCEYDRYLPREMFPPGTHTGQFRYRFYAGEFDWGSEAAVLVRHQSREHCYRVQLSTEYQELILWHGMGGYLQVVPCVFATGRTYSLSVLARGRNVRVLVDGQTMIDYWHRTLPTLAGRIGLGAYRSTVAFEGVTVTALPPADTVAPAHRAKFTTRGWRTLRWVFDGHEPICLLEKDERPSKHATHRLYYHQVKLLPGYRPYYTCWMGVQPGYGATMTQLLGDEDAIKTSGEGTDELTLSFEGEDGDRFVRAATTDRVGFDTVRGTYRHEVETVATFLKDRDIGTFEFVDPLTYNNKEPGRGVRNRWLSAGHRWGILRGADGRAYRHPISQTLNLHRQNNWHLAGDSHLWMLYPDRAACPAWEHRIPGETLEMGVCHWGYDWHQRIRYLGGPKQFSPGDRQTFRFVMTAYPPEEGERLYRASALHRQHESLESLDRYQPDVRARLEPSSVPDGFAIPICDPAGTDFTRLGSIREPFVGWPWRGRYRLDATAGRNDTHSLRLEGPAEVNGLIYHHMIDPAERYLCTVWLKTAGIGDTGPVVKLKYSYRDTPCDVVETGLIADSDWQEVSFVTTVPAITFETYDASTFELKLAGRGTVWLDDFAIRPLAEDEAAVDRLPPTAVLRRIPFVKSESK